MSKKKLGPPVIHGDVGSSEYRAWGAMKNRCDNPNNAAYASYGGRGIAVCARWSSSYPAFLEDMGRKPSPAHSIDRIDNAGDYKPSNCRWATKSEQALNTRRNSLLTYNGETLTLTDWSKRVGIDMKALWARIDLGWSAKKTLTTPIGEAPRQLKTHCIRGHELVSDNLIHDRKGNRYCLACKRILAREGYHRRKRKKKRHVYQ